MPKQRRTEGEGSVFQHTTKTLMPAGYAENGEYEGPCPDCGTDHGDAAGPETIGGKMACLQAQAVAAGNAELVGQISIARDWVHLAQANTLGIPSELDEWRP